MTSTKCFYKFKIIRWWTLWEKKGISLILAKCLEMKTQKSMILRIKKKRKLKTYKYQANLTWLINWLKSLHSVMTNTKFFNSPAHTFYISTSIYKLKSSFSTSWEDIAFYKKKMKTKTTLIRISILCHLQTYMSLHKNRGMCL